MSLKFQHHSLVSSRNSFGTHVSCKRVANLDYLLTNWGYLRKKCLIRQNLFDGQRLVGCTNTFSAFRESRKMRLRFLLASAEDGVTVNGSPQTSTSTDVDKIRVKLNQSLQGENSNNGLVQSLHDAARVFELAIKEQGSLSRLSWFSAAWLGVDRNAWVKTVSYQAAIYSLLLAASEISSRGDSRDRDINVFVQRSLLRQAAPLESLIREELSAKQPEAYDWFWTEQVPAVIIFFVNYFEGDLQFNGTTNVCGKGKSLGAGSASDKALLMLALTCVAAITKLGPAKISCSHFSSMIPDITGRMMEMLIDFIPIHQAYHSIKDIGLGREFLVHFGPRAASCRVENDQDSEEVIFWVDLVQKQLQQAIDREKIWSRLTTSESIEVLERDLAIFGFFIALGRNTQTFLSANGFGVIDNPIEGIIRYLIGGSVLYYPQLSSISSYQLYVEVVCEELDWLPFYPGNVVTSKPSHGHKGQQGPPNIKAIPQVLDVCSHWMQSFIKYSKWLENPSNVKAARFLSRGHNKLMECMEELGLSKNETESSSVRTGLTTENDTDSFDKALESVEEALKRLENLLQELHVSSSYSGKEQLKAACSDLEKIRKLKKEAEFLEASFRAKEAFFRQGDADDNSQSSISEQEQYPRTKTRKNATVTNDRSNSKSRGLWTFLARPRTRSTESLAAEKLGNESIEQSASNIGIVNSEPNEIHRFEQLRNELIELEKRVKRSADQSASAEDIKVTDDHRSSVNNAGHAQLVEVQKKENIIEKSLHKIRETSTDVLQGTQLLAIDVAAATELLRRALVGDELAEKEKKALRRTLTDLASVIPIGVLMLLPVTAVGHAAILAAIQRYVPALIPSTYGSERLDLLRQLEKVKEIETSEVDSEENLEEVA